MRRRSSCGSSWGRWGMSDWIATKLGDHIKVLPGFPFQSELFSTESGTPLIRIRDLLASRLETFYQGACDAQFLVRDGDILIGMDGDFNVVRWNKGAALLNQRVCAVASASVGLDDGFLYWALGPRIDEIHRTTPQTTVKHLSTKDLRLIRFDLPPRPEQSAIARILDTLDTQIEKTQTLIAKLEQVKEGLLHDLLTRGVDESGELRPSVEEAPQLYRESALGLIPRGWDAVSLKDTIEDLLSGQHIETQLCNTDGRGVPYFTGPTAFSGATTVVTSFTEHPQVMCKTGDLLITVKGSGCGKAALAAHDACISRQLMAIRVRGGTEKFWLFVFERFQDALNRQATGGNIPGLSRKQLLELKLSLPATHQERQMIGRRLESAEALTQQARAEQAELLSLKSGLMDDLLTGRVRVTPPLGSEHS